MCCGRKTSWDGAANKKNSSRAADIAPWYHLRLQSCSRRFEPQAHHLCYFRILLLKFWWERGENKPKRPGLAHLKNYSRLFQKLVSCFQCDQIVILFFNIWPLAAMKISLIMSLICQSMLSISKIDYQKFAKIWSQWLLFFQMMLKLILNWFPAWNARFDCVSQLWSFSVYHQ